jgi:hypothetical protein
MWVSVAASHDLVDPNRELGSSRGSVGLARMMTMVWDHPGVKHDDLLKCFLEPET